jgi:hypothetical protein
MSKAKVRTAGEWKAIVRENKRARGLVLVSEVWILPEQRPRLDALLAEFRYEIETLESQEAQALLA